MERLAPRYEPNEVEAASRAFWAERARRRDAGASTNRSGRPVRQFLGTLTPADSPATMLQRTVVADAEARYLGLSGRRAEWSLRLRSPWVGPSKDEAVARLVRAGVVGPSGDPEGLAERRRWMLGHLADARVLVSRDLPLRVCPSCRTPRTPETIVYDAEPGHAYLVRFAIPDEAEPTSLLVWTDEVWKLLGTVALLVNPETTYVVARFTRRETTERVIVSRAALDRLAHWLPGSTIDVLEEKLGADLAGGTYTHPLTLEYPPLSQLVSPAGSVVASNDVSDTGTGIVTLTPSHGAGDAAVARAHRMEGPSVVGADGLVESSRPHKYAGLELGSAEAFILRDLAEGGSMFAELMVRRGVPHCAVCGAGLRWVPGRAWCLEPGRLSGESLGQFARLLPDDTVPLTSEVVPWSVSETTPSVDPSDPLLSECSQCERLSTAPTGERCACGGAFVAVRRRLLPAFSEAVDSWASARSLDPSDPIRLYLPRRRRAPALLHHLAAREGLDAPPADVRLIVLPTLPPGRLGESFGQDALRAALLRTDQPPRTLAGVEDRAVQEYRRLGKFWTLAGQVLEHSLADGFEPEGPIASHLPELAEEDRAFLSTFERLRAEVRRRYDAGDLAGAQGLLARFAEVDLREGYFPMVAGRLAVPGLPPSKVAAFRVLHHVVTRWVELYAPVAPFAMEAIHRAFQPDGASVFDGLLAPGLDAVITAEAEGDYERWQSFGAALRVGRRRFGIPPTTQLPRAILLVTDEAVAARLRVAAPILSRLARVSEILVGSPAQPWEGRRVEVRPILPAIQKTYGAQSARVVRILEQIPSRRVQEGVRAGTLSIALDGRQMPIMAGMVEFAESLPDDVVPAAWGHGEILISLPPDTERHRRRAPALSLDGYQIVRHLERRLQRAGGVAPELVVVSANGVLGEEMAKHAAAVALYAGVGQIAVNDGTITLPPGETSSGRTRRGERWRVYVPGLPVPPSTRKAQRASVGRRRIPEFIEPRPEPEALEVLEQSLRVREESVRAIVEQIDHVVGRPVVGPAKVRLAIAAGLPTFEAISKAPYEQLSAIPGFGPFVAGALVESFGGAVPAPTPRHRPRLHRPGNGEAERPTVPADVVEPTYFPEVLVDAPPVSIPTPLEPLTAPAPTVPAPVAATPAPLDSSVATPVPPPPSAPVQVAPAVAVPIVPAAPTFARPETVPQPPAPPVLSSPTALPSEPPAPEVPLPPASGVRLTLGDREDPAWRGFLDATSAGHKGLCLSREFPERRRALLGPRDVEVVWLSNVGKGSAVRPGDLPALTALLTLALTDRGVTAVFVEGGEYLVRIHGVGPVADLLRQLDSLAVERSARIWWPINPALMPSADVEVLRGVVTVEAPEPAA